MDFSPDGRRVYTGGDDAMLRTWDLYGDQQFLRRTFALRGGQDFIDVQASPDGRRLAYFSSDQARISAPFPRHRHGEMDEHRESPVKSRSWSGGPGIPTAGTLRSTESPRRRHRAGCPDRRTDTPSPGGQGCGHLLDRLRRQGRTAGRRGHARTECGSSTPSTLRPSGPEVEVAVAACCPVVNPDGGTAMVFDRNRRMAPRRPGWSSTRSPERSSTKAPSASAPPPLRSRRTGNMSRSPGAVARS